MQLKEELCMYVCVYVCVHVYMCVCVHEGLYDSGATRVQVKETAVQEVTTPAF